MSIRSLFRFVLLLGLFCTGGGCSGADSSDGSNGPEKKPTAQGDTDEGPVAGDTDVSGDAGQGDSNDGDDDIAGDTDAGDSQAGDPSCLDCGDSDIDVATSFIGGACGEQTNCLPDDGWCLPDGEGYPQGMCTLACDLYCPDADDEPVTFCVEGAAGGECVSRCDFDLFPGAGCRGGYGCVLRTRNNQPATSQWVCLPQDGASQACADPMNLSGDDDCYFAALSFGDETLEGLARALADGTFEAGDGEAFLDLNFAYSQVFIEDELGSTIYGNYSTGHLESSPMSGMIVHYTANQREDSTIRYFVSSAPHASSHFVVGSHRNGLVVQMFSHRNRTWHAGTTYNKDRFGFDFANAGYLKASGDGWEDYAGRDYTTFLPLHGAEPVMIDDGIPSAGSKYSGHDHWQPYTYYQLLSYVIVARALHDAWGLTAENVQRHGDVAGSRVDPGPAFAMTALMPLIFNQDNLLTTPWLLEYKVDPEWIVDHPEAR